MTNILIADDHDVVRRGLRAILESRSGWQVIAEARDGKEAVSAAFQSKPDVAIIDYGLPLLNGIEAARQIRHHLPTTEVLIFTMHNSDDILHDALQAGARGFLLKSDADDYLMAAVHALSQGVGEADRIFPQLERRLGAGPHATGEVRGPADRRGQDAPGDGRTARRQLEDRRGAPCRRPAQAQPEDDRRPDPLCGPQQARRGLIAKTCAVQGGRDAIV
jgi:DNA-binding NarL/FixJ family response regulator